MSKVYVLTSGEYSEYSITAVFSTKEAAEEYAAIDQQGSPYRRHRDYHVEEWDLDAMAGWKLRTVFKVILDTATGNEKKSPWSWEEMAPPNARVRGQECGDALALGESFVSFDHARKLAVEALQKYRAEKSGLL